MLYSYRRSDRGRIRGEFPLGKIAFDEHGLRIQVRDRALREQLEAYFAEEIWVPIPLGDQDRVMGHTWEVLEPGEPEHFEEAVRRLPQLELLLERDAETG